MPAENNSEQRAAEHPRTLPLLSTVAGGAAVTCGFALGKAAAAGAGLFMASMLVGLALLFSVGMLVARRASNFGRSSGRGVAMFACALALAVAVTTGAGALSRS